MSKTLVKAVCSKMDLCSSDEASATEVRCPND